MPSELICSSSTTLTVGSPLMISASHSFPLRTVLDAFVQFASVNSCNNLHKSTATQSSSLLSTASVFLVALFRQDAWFPAQTATSLYTQQNARFLFRPSRKRPHAYLLLLKVSLLCLPHRATTHATLSFSPSTAVDVHAPCNDPLDITRSCPYRT